MNNQILKGNVFSLILIVFYIIGSMVLSIFLYNTTNQVLFNFIVYTLFFLIPTLAYILITKQSFKRTLSIKPINLKSLLLIIGFSLTIQPLMMFISAASNLFFENMLDDTLFQLADMPIGLLIFTLAIMPAIFEEIPTRGVFLSAYRDDGIDIKIIALVNGLLFGALHLNFQQFFYAFALGFLFVFLVEITSSILSSILAHFVINGVQVTFFVIQMHLTEIMGNEVNDLANVIPDKRALLIATVMMLFFALLFTPLAGFLLYLLAKANNKEELLTFKFKEGSLGIFKSPQMITFYITIGIFLIVGILTELFI